MTWKFRRSCWLSGPLTIRLETCPRRKLVFFELFNTTRFVRSFASLQEAQKHAESMGWAEAS
jgi:hypothetical protein